MSEKAETPKGNLRKTAGPGGRAQHKVETKRRTKDTANPTDIAPPQEQDRQLEPERLRNPLRVTCGRTLRRKPQAPQEEAQKESPARGSTIAYPTPSRRRERRHSSAAPERTHTHTQEQPVRRSAAKTHKASYCRRRCKRRIGIRSEKATPQAQPRNTSASAKFPKQEQKSPKLARKPRIWGKGHHLGNTAQGNYKNLHWNRQRNQRQRYRKNTGPNTTHA